MTPPDAAMTPEQIAAMTDTLTPEELAAIRERHSRRIGDHPICSACGRTVPCDAERQAAHIDTLTAAAQKARDLLAWYCWSEDDLGDENDLADAYEALSAALGPSTEEGVAATRAAILNGTRNTDD